MSANVEFNITAFDEASDVFSQVRSSATECFSTVESSASEAASSVESSSELMSRSAQNVTSELDQAKAQQDERNQRSN